MLRAMSPQANDSTLLVELGVEDLPPGFQLRIIQSGEEIKESLLRKGVKWNQCRIFVTPRRIVLWAEGMGLNREILEREVIGPPYHQAFDEGGKPTIAAQKFAEKLGRSAKELYVVEQESRQYLAGRVRFSLSLSQHLSRILPDWILSLNEFYEKRMKWGKETFSFVRPIRWILALLDDRIIPVQLGSLRASRYTFTHYYSDRKKVRLSTISDYFRYVPLEVLDIEKRREKVLRQLSHPVREYQEVDCTYELPGWGIGHFSQEFLRLPREVIEAVIVKQLRCYPLYASDGSLLPRFLFTVDRQPGEWNVGEVQKGYEAVANARLTDALYFYENDTRIPFHQRVESLKGIQFLQGMGSYYEKITRLEWMMRNFNWHQSIAGVSEEVLLEASRLCRADQTTQMVREFTNLEGIMGKIYLLDEQTSCHLSGAIRQKVASAIYESYLPRGANEPIPVTLEGIVLSLADKLDSLLAFSFSGYRPTGGKDPLGARRFAAHILRIVFHTGADLFLRDMLNKTAQSLWQKPLDETFFRSLFEERGENFSREQIADWNYDIFAICRPYLFLRPQYFFCLQKFLISRTGKRLSEYARIATRVHNLACEAQNTLSLKPENFVEPEEIEVFHQVVLPWEEWINRKQRAGIFPAEEQVWDEWLGEVSEERVALLDRFFDRVLVMHPDERLRKNRLALLQHLDQCLQILGDMSASGRSMEIFYSRI